ncbi:MAG: peptidylprolyl isomerase [Candidatus Pacebacteria bacterium]|nr:peptidylprolyl isomerase [Candidatus Paceibacterota bacterium]
MLKKIFVFVITFAFLGGGIWFINNNSDIIFKNTKMKERIVKNLSFNKEPEMKIDAAKKYKAEIETSEGIMKFELFASETPKTVNNFVFLAKEGFYENTFFHRIIKGFMIQGGDPKGDGTGGPGYSFSDEPVTRDYEKGVIAMANAGANTNGSQFFIMQDKIGLEKNYTIFGKLIEGEEILDKIAETPVIDNGWGEVSKPTMKVYIEKINIEEE